MRSTGRTVGPAGTLASRPRGWSSTQGQGRVERLAPRVWGLRDHIARQVTLAEVLAP